jgi:proprotein convertase subtilisin/kexin type 5
MDYFENECKTCHAFCATCSGPSELDCVLGILYWVDVHFLIKLKKNNILGCQISTYRNNTDNQCKSCSSNCARCFGPDELDCLIGKKKQNKKNDKFHLKGFLS